MNENKRKTERFPTKAGLQAINSIDNGTLGILINLSTSGFMLMSGADSPEPDSIYQLKLVDTLDNELNITVGATCVWREEASTNDSYWCGFKFLDVPPEAQQALNDYLSQLIEE